MVGSTAGPVMAEGVSIDQVGMVAAQLVQFFVLNVIVPFDSILFEFVVGIVTVLPEGEVIPPVSDSPALLELALSYVRVCVAHISTIYE